MIGSGSTVWSDTLAIVNDVDAGDLVYRGTSFTRNSTPQGAYSRSMPRALW